MTFTSLNNIHSPHEAGRLQPHGPQSPNDSSNERAAASFAAALTTKLGENLNDTASELDAAAVREQQQSEQVREAAEQLVASAFILPFLQQVRNESLGSDLFHGGYAEDAFGQQLDTHLADDFVHSGNFPLVDAVEQYMTKRGVPAAEALGRQVNLHG
ncbi:MAG: hypothetical protein WD534_16555 [Phycisphaeraceae bacterium]